MSNIHTHAYETFHCNNGFHHHRLSDGGSTGVSYGRMPTSIFNSQSSIFNSQSSIFNFQSSIIKGDANGDGDVNISDAVLLVNNLLGTTAIGFIAENCDMNSDGDLNVSDVALIIKLIMEGDNTMGPGDAEDPDVNGN